MKALTIGGFIVTLAGAAAIVVALTPPVSLSAAAADGQSRGRELTILSGSGGELGVSIADGKAGGVEIEEVSPNSAAEKAGLERGDVIVEFDGEHVRSTRQFTRLVRETPAGRTVKATISRDGKKQDVQVTLAEGRDSHVILGSDDRLFFDRDAFREGLRGFAERLPEMERGLRDLPNFNYRFDFPGAMSGGRLGVTVNELTSQLATYFGAKDGVLVTSVSEGSAGDKAGIKAGDVIATVNGERITSSADLVQTLRRAESEEVSIGIVREKKEQTLKAKIEPARRSMRGARPA